jgi:hypothetical protein
MRKSTKSPTDSAAGELAAFRRAAKTALKLAKQTGTPCYVMNDGKIVDIAKSKLRRKRTTL